LDEIPAEVQSWIGKVRYEEESEFEIERGYFFTTCASVENGNPIFWDDEVAQELTNGPIAPPTMLSVWFRPHYWIPGRTEVPLPWQIHFDLKETLNLPEAVATDSEVAYGEPVRPGDRIRIRQSLRSISDIKTTKLGKGRFWVIDAECVNQRGEWVGTETMTGFGYRRDD
jgi:hypothetical protein